MALFGGMGGATGGGVGDIVAFVKLSGAQKFNNDLNKLNQKVNNSAKVMNKAMNASIIAGVAAFGAATVAAAKFEAEMANVNTLLNVSDQQFQTLNKGVLDIAKDVPVAMSSLTKGLYDLISAGAPASKSIDSLALASKAATAGLTGVDVAIRAGMATINAYAMDISNLDYIYDLQFATVKKGVLTYEQLAGAIGNVLPSAASLGVSLEDLYGSLAHVTKAGIDAQSAATYIARALDNMTKQSDKWAKIGIPIFDETSGSFRGMRTIMGELAEKTKGLTAEQKELMLQSLQLNIRSGKAIKAMINNYDGFIDTLDEVTESAGAMEEAFEKQKETLKAQAGILKNQLQVAFIELGVTILPVLKAITSALGKNPEVLASIVKVVGTLAISLGGLAVAYKLTAAASALMATALGPYVLAVVGVIAILTAFNALSDMIDRKRHERIDAISDEIDYVHGLRDRYHELAGKKDLTETETAELQTVSEKLTVALGLEKDEVGRLKDELDKLVKKNDELIKQNLEEKIETLRIKIKEYKDETTPAIAAQAFSPFTALIQSLRDIKKYGFTDAISQGTKFDEVLADLERELKEVNIRLKENKEDIDDVVDSTSDKIDTDKKLLTVQELLAKAGIKTSDSIQLEMDKLKALIPVVKGDTFATQQLIDKIKALEDSLRSAIDPIERAEWELAWVKANKNMSTFSGTAETLKIRIKDLEPELNKNTKAVDKSEKALFKHNKTLVEGIYLFGELTKVLGISDQAFMHFLRTAESAARGDWVGMIGAGLGLAGRAFGIGRGDVGFGEAFRVWAEGWGEETGIIFGETFARGLWTAITEGLKELPRTGDIIIADVTAPITPGKIRDLHGEVAALNIELAIWQQTLADLEQRKIDIDIELTAATKEHFKTIKGLEKVILYLQRKDVNFYYVAKELERLIGLTAALTINWEDMIAEMFQDYTQFEQDLKTATAAIDQILYFDIDLDTTNVDEQINAAIWRMKDYLGTLAPGSQAHKDAKEGLDILIAAFLAMGGELDREKAIEFNTTLAEQGITEVTGWIDDLFDKAAEQKITVELDIAAAQTMIQALIDKIDELIRAILGVPDIIIGGKMPDWMNIITPGLTQPGLKPQPKGAPITAPTPTTPAIIPGVPSPTPVLGPAQPVGFGTTGAGSPAQFEINVYEATHRTNVEIVNKDIYPRMKYMERNLETPESPF